MRTVISKTVSHIDDKLIVYERYIHDEKIYNAKYIDNVLQYAIDVTWLFDKYNNIVIKHS